MNEQSSIVYLYGFSTSLESKLITVKQLIDNQLKQIAHVSFVFIQDGVIGTSLKNKMSHSMQELLSLPITFYSMIPDLEARGLETNTLQNKIEGIGYEELVEILATSSKIVSWM